VGVEAAARYPLVTLWARRSSKRIQPEKSKWGEAGLRDFPFRESAGGPMLHPRVGAYGSGQYAEQPATRFCFPKMLNEFRSKLMGLRIMRDLPLGLLGPPLEL
jgi:hypothetical protein